MLLKMFMALSLATGPIPVAISALTTFGDRPGAIVLDDFESYRPNGLPTRWSYIDARQRLIPVNPSIMNQDEFFVVSVEGGNKFVRAITSGRAHRLIMPNGTHYSWSLSERPHLAWEWRAQKLPVGAREDRSKQNDTGAAVYVTFERDWLGRPRSIKYTYSSTLPVGTTLTSGRLAVVVVSSGKDGIGKWRKIERDVAADFRKLFGGNPPDKPFSIMIWSDSDSCADRSEADFDNIRIF